MAAVFADDARLLELYPELAEVAPAQRAVWLEVAQGIVFAETFKKTLDAAHAAMTGHLLTVAGLTKQGGGKKVQSKSLGPASITYAVGQVPPDEQLAETTYGEHYLLLLRARPHVVCVI